MFKAIILNSLKKARLVGTTLKKLTTIIITVSREIDQVRKMMLNLITPTLVYT